jgi:hypothetical protein
MFFFALLICIFHPAFFYLSLCRHFSEQRISSVEDLPKFLIQDHSVFLLDFPVTFMDLLHGSRCICNPGFPGIFFWIFLYLSSRIFLSLSVYLPWISHTDLTVSSMDLPVSLVQDFFVSRIQDFLLSHCISNGSLISDLAVSPLDFPVSLIQNFPVFLMDLLVSLIQDFLVSLCVSSMDFSSRISPYRSWISLYLTSRISLYLFQDFPVSFMDLQHGSRCISHPGFPCMFF